jgi:chromosome segregation ATPase
MSRRYRAIDFNERPLSPIRSIGGTGEEFPVESRVLRNDSDTSVLNSQVQELKTKLESTTRELGDLQTALAKHTFELHQQIEELRDRFDKFKDSFHR